MRDVFRRVAVAIGLAAISWGAPALTEAQIDRRDVPFVAQPQQRFDAGQDVQPIYEGWQRHDDGRITLYFGYLNRNHREQPNVPIGPSNYFSPGEPDRGQPTYFYPRTHRFQFAVQVSGDMGTAFEDGLVWTVIRNGSEQRAVAWLKNSGIAFGRAKDVWYENQPPRVSVRAPASVVKVGQPLTVTAAIEDDELPAKIGSRAIAPEAPTTSPRGRSLTDVPSLRPPEGTPPPPDNIQWYQRPRPPRNGLSVHWVVYRGPAGATIDPPDYQRAVSEDEKEPAGTQARRYPSVGPRSKVSTSLAGDGWTSATFETIVTFDEPGTYTLRAFASDGMRVTPADLTVTVGP
jgi:hypothetical protein